ncbi:glycosyltransferase family 2 protein [Candidatus Parcubacteria bacterium]|nr:glycosyltransferase family 2 protein [Candidatus Parcubacteria bacterium]
MDFNFPISKPSNRKDYYIQRSIEMLPGIITWSFLIIGLYLAFRAPIAMAIFIIIFDLYWMVKVFYITVFIIFGYRRIKIWEKIDWIRKCEKLGDTDNIYRTVPEIARHSISAVIPSWRDLYHLIIIPTYKEEIEVLETTLDSILNSDYPKNRIILVVAFEERAGEDVKERARMLEEKYKDKFFGYITTLHPDGISGEAKVKGANASWAAEEARIFLDEKGIKYENVIVSTFDSDTCVHCKYFSCLAYQFMRNPKRLQCSYQPLPLYNNNIWQTNSIVRVIMTSSSFWQIMQSVRYNKMVTFSSHSMSFKTLVDVNYWPRDMISDDSIIFWKCYVLYHGDYFVEPIFLTVSLDAVLADNHIKTVLNLYKQQRRWAWGIENVPIIYRAFLKDKKIPLHKKISKGWEELIGRISWGLTPIIIALFGWFPLWFGGDKFNQTVLALNLPKVLGYLMTFAMFGLIVSMFLSLFLLPPPPQKISFFRKIIMVFQWILAPIVAIPLGALPMIDAQTRILFGKYMEFWVTEKVRK